MKYKKIFLIIIFYFFYAHFPCFPTIFLTPVSALFQKHGRKSADFFKWEELRVPPLRFGRKDHSQEKEESGGTTATGNCASLAIAFEEKTNSPASCARGFLQEQLTSS
jgi:hypothetical protein